jgi:hypothetical protein
MKKGKTSKLSGFKNAKIIYGTVDSVNFKTTYLNIQTWVEPKIFSENWKRIVLNLSRSIKHTLHEKLNYNIFDDKFIVDLDLRHSGLIEEKKSFMNLEITLYLKETDIGFKTKKMKDEIKELTQIIFDENFNENDYFSFHLRKTSKISNYKIQS